MNIETNSTVGLSTQDALKKLHEDIKKVVDAEYENQKRKKLKKDLNHKILSNYSIFISLLVIAGLFITTYYFTGVLVLLLLIFNIYFVYREEKLKSTEMLRKTQELLDEIELSINLSKDWKSSNYPPLCSPLSPCISLSWCYRDHELRNLPTALLVEGDVIILRVGQISPANVREITNHSKPRSFKLGETYGHSSKFGDAPTKPIAVQPLPDLMCIVEHTPFIDNLEYSLEHFLDRPPTFHNHQRHILINIYLQKYVFIIVLFLVIGTIILRAFDSYFFKGKIMHTNWTNIGILNCVSSLFSLSPLIFPLLWINLHHWGSARLQTLLSIPQPLMQVEKSKSSPEMMDTPTSDLDMPIIPRKQVFFNYLRILNGSCDLLSRSTNIIQVLGSVSAFCCVDKKGLLSWPNPTPEKVFFLRDANVDGNSKNSSESSLNSESTDQNEQGTVAEVLDVTNDQNSPFKLEFDDHEWKNHLSSLKPLGLAILVNTCCDKTQYAYSKFCSHIAAASMIDKNLVPVTNRYDLCASFMHGRCLCELARQIGFLPQAKNIFNFEGQISSYRHLQPEVIRRDTRFAKSLHLATKIKIPFPHSLSVVIREFHGGALQLLSQGTADIILDSCDDFWSGKDLRPLKEEERKRAQDFYQRNALTAYCTAFSYRPLRHGITGSLAGPKPSDISSCDVAYLELPPETFKRFRHSEKNNCDFEGHSMSHSISSDSLLFSDVKEEPVSDIDGCFEMQSHQIFIGMVTMQYQAISDIVQLIERFEKACIRFVHFSKENELRSRVFSEKMGLESGWNCHISLLEPDEHNSIPSPKHSKSVDVKEKDQETKDITDEYSRLLPHSNFESTKMLSSSAPCAISDPTEHPNNEVNEDENKETSRNSSISNHDSVMEGLPNEDIQNQSISITTDSSEQSNPIPIYISNRAKLPRGIKNIEPHIENVDNVPLLVSLFTDCLPEATKEMLRIMQAHGEICVVMGSAANANSNCQIFLQANCAIGCEPLYPSVCQNLPAYTESNLYNNKQKYLSNDRSRKWYDIQKSVTISPIYLSRMLNSLPCSISVRRDEPISILGLIELARKFSIGLWNCVQFYSCTAIMFSILNMLSCAMSLPPIILPDLLLYLMCFIVAPLAISLVRIEFDANIMNRACGKKSMFKVDFNTFLFILWCYGAKYIVSIVILIVIYLFTVDHIVFDLVAAHEEDFIKDTTLARQFILFGAVLHLVIISSSFVHRDYSFWQKSPTSNSCWMITSLIILVAHFLLFICQVVFNEYNLQEMNEKWPALIVLIASVIVIAGVAELCKYYEIKKESRGHRRARLDFGTKLGMNSPF